MMEDKSDSPGAVKAEDKSTSVLFTYFQGDINSVVDEHFSRALQKLNKPEDLRTKSDSRMPLSGEEEPPSVPWGFSSSSWLEPTFPSTSSGQIQFNAPMGPQLPQRAMTGPGSQPSGLWSFAPRPGTNFGLTSMVYSSPVSPEAPGPADRQYTNSFLGLLHSDRPMSGSALSTPSKADLSSNWNTHTAFRDPLSSGLNLDSGFPLPEKTKDLHWY